MPQRLPFPPIVDVNVPAGYYAAAYRYVKTATVQSTELITLSVVTGALSLSETGSGSGSKKATHRPSTSQKAQDKKAA